MHKGDSGYLTHEKQKHLKLGLLLIGGAVLVYLSGYLLTDTNQNYGTIMAVLLLLPSAQMWSKYLTICGKKPNAEIRRVLDEEPMLVYDLLMVWGKKLYHIEAAYLNHGQVVFYYDTSHKKAPAKQVEKDLTTMFIHKGMAVSFKALTTLEDFVNYVKSIEDQAVVTEDLQNIKVTLLRNSI